MCVLKFPSKGIAFHICYLGPSFFILSQKSGNFLYFFKM